MRSLLALLLLAAFLNALSWIILIPVWQYPDEQAHFAQVQDLAELGFVPKVPPDTSYEIALSEEILGTSRDNLGNNKFTYHPEYRIQYSDSFTGPQELTIANLPKSARTNLVKDEATLNPPLYYLLGAAAYKLFDNGDLFSRVYAVRIVSLVLFLGLILVTYKIGQIIFEKGKILPLALATLVSFKPMLVFASTGVLPDSLVNLLFSLALLFGLKILKNGLAPFDLVAVLTIVTAGVFARQQFLIAVPIIALSVAFGLIKNFSKVGLALTAASVLFFYLVSNFFPGFDYIRRLVVPEIGTPDLKLLFQPEFTSYLLTMIRQNLFETWPWYWGVYRWLSLTLPLPIYQIINRLIVVALIGLAIKFLIIIKERKLTGESLILLFMLIASGLYWAIFVIWDYFFQTKYGFSFGLQGRYFFPLVVAHLAILLAGLWQISEIVFKKYSFFAVLILVFLMILFNNVSLAYVAASYYDLSSFSTFVEHVSHYKPDLLKGEIIYLVLSLNIIFQGVYLFNLASYVHRKIKI